MGGSNLIYKCRLLTEGYNNNINLFILSTSQIITSLHFFKMAQTLDLRCVLLSNPTTLGAGGPNQNASQTQYMRIEV